ncbi:class II aldolase/adducin family protein [Acetobacter oeni]|uniref:Class II aldolase n=1 Tax=Acetobacter oeni TaxID=304077 RepID=A0A511XL09_9PROT|nr:class II aldolase/adducin family protein [Acetobacter oeni]MBB3883214.1 ribulose-5-phosphate 4-epimerase/fuculose-1-phosphate aldolase [Acetobacter oeni]NHO19280.1 class II aldolase/adducin family protein [Acetobacter oeni]GBR07296.1 ribulose-5-phosphate 4-epimerase [Acetobacter oeni LMG 21952]GEN63637.1 class II aldolase [Acetobacter oeni]
MTQASYSAEEWTARCELAALYRLIAFYRMTDLVDTHISLRIPGDDQHFLINRYGVAFDRMRASDLVRIDKSGVVQDMKFTDLAVNAAGFVIHSAIHQAREDMACVIHTHTPAGVAVSAQKQGLLPISQHALKYYGKLSYHTYEGIALSPEERERLVSDLGMNRAMILRNHGLLAGGPGVKHAFHEIYMLERACQIQVQALSGGCELSIPSEDVCRRTTQQFMRDDSEHIISIAWDAALSLIEDQKASYTS